MLSLPHSVLPPRKCWPSLCRRGCWYRSIHRMAWSSAHDRCITHFAAAVCTRCLSWSRRVIVSACAVPSVILSQTSSVTPDYNEFTGFVFKLQANLDPRHRDRLAYIRVVSGRYEKGMKVQLPPMQHVYFLSCQPHTNDGRDCIAGFTMEIFSGASVTARSDIRRVSQFPWSRDSGEAIAFPPE